ncbi:MAG: hypothetical protein WBJ41_11105 [Chromatiaceae bacterium]
MKAYFLVFASVSLFSGCANSPESLEVRKDMEKNPSNCVNVLASGFPYSDDKRLDGIPPSEFQKLRSAWDYCQSKSGEEIKAYARSISISNQADKEIENKNYLKAWKILLRTPPSEIKVAKKYLENHPQVYKAAIDEFSFESLSNLKSKQYGSSYPYRQLEYLSPFLGEKDAKVYQENIEKIFGKRSKSMIEKDSVNYGRIAGIQFENRSHINTSGGAQLGAVAGQAMYFDNTSWKNYSAVNQLGVGLLGAMVGSGLDQPTSIQFQRTYWVTLNSGETISISSPVSDQSHIPQGVCVAVSGGYSVSTANESKCSNKKE